MPKENWNYDNIPDQSGRVALVTGANSGLGFQESLMLAKKGAEVILVGRNQVKIEQAMTTILEQVPAAKLAYEKIDLADLDSIAHGAENIKRNYERLDLLLNNAGVMIPPLSYTKQGFELQFGTNHLGHFALTGQLLPLILQTPDSRIASMTSLVGRSGTIDFNDLNYKHRQYRKMLAYGQSKLANILFINELAHRLVQAGAKTTAVVAHPGGANTNLMNNGGFVLRRIITPLGSQPVSDGALPILRATCDPNSRNGSFWGPSGRFGLTGSPIEIKMSAKENDRSQCQQLWNVSEQLTDVSYGEMLAPGK